MDRNNNKPIRDYTPLNQRRMSGARSMSDISPPSKRPAKANTPPTAPDPIPVDDIDETDSKIIDLYSDFNEDVKLASDKELEELKRIAQADALRAYSVFRRLLTQAQLKLKSTISLTGKLKSRKSVYVFGALIIAVVGVAGFKQLTVSKSGSSVLGLNDAQITFTPLVPPERQEFITERSYDEEVDVLSFQDEIGGQNVTIAQQLVPEAIISQPDGPERMASGLSADGTFETVETPKGKLFVSTKVDGGQTAVIIYNQVLMFINNTQEFNDEALIDYINNL